VREKLRALERTTPPRTRVDAGDGRKLDRDPTRSPDFDGERGFVLTSVARLSGNRVPVRLAEVRDAHMVGNVNPEQKLHPDTHSPSNAEDAATDGGAD
jgi:hypothetical protein